MMYLEGSPGAHHRRRMQRSSATPFVATKRDLRSLDGHGRASVLFDVPLPRASASPWPGILTRAVQTGRSPPPHELHHTLCGYHRPTQRCVLGAVSDMRHDEEVVRVEARHAKKLNLPFGPPECDEMRTSRETFEKWKTAVGTHPKCEAIKRANPRRLPQPRFLVLSSNWCISTPLALDQRPDPLKSTMMCTFPSK